MEVVAGLSLKNLEPKVWDACSRYYLPGLRAVMVSYADFDYFRARRRRAMETGLRTYLNMPDSTRVYLDNGAFAFLRRGFAVSHEEYEAFVREAKPDWYPPPRDYIPAPSMAAEEQECLRQLTMAENTKYNHDGFVPVLHVGRFLDQYVADLNADAISWAKPNVALGGIVPNLLRAPKALPYRAVLDMLCRARRVLAGKKVLLFGVGGTATLHLAALLEMDSVDSSGWRNRAARGIVQLPGRGDRTVANLGSWRGREPSPEEWALLRGCQCPACQLDGVEGLRAGRLAGFCHRATHNLWTLLEEATAIQAKLAEGIDAYAKWYPDHIDNSTYAPLIAYALDLRRQS